MKRQRLESWYKTPHNLEWKGESSMPKEAELLMCQGVAISDRGFLMEYQRCVLLALEKEGILHREQVEECIYRLGKQNL